MRVTTVETVDNGTKEIVKETLSKIKLEKNSKGYNWEITLDFDRHESESVEKVFADIRDYDNRLRILYSSKDEGVTK